MKSNIVNEFTKSGWFEYLKVIAEKSFTHPREKSHRNIFLFSLDLFFFLEISINLRNVMFSFLIFILF